MAWLLLLGMGSAAETQSHGEALVLRASVPPWPISDEPLPQDPDRPPVKVDLSALKAHNVFSPHRTVPRPAPAGAETVATAAAAAPARPRPPVVTGFFLDPETRAPKVVVEDRNEPRLKLLHEPKFLAAGDEVLGCRVESVKDGVAVVVLGEVRKEVRVGDAVPDGNWEPPAGAPPGEAPALDAGAANDILERLRQRNRRRREGEP